MGTGPAHDYDDITKDTDKVRAFCNTVGFVKSA
jgi:hypothetical protein